MNVSVVLDREYVRGLGPGPVLRPNPGPFVSKFSVVFTILHSSTDRETNLPVLRRIKNNYYIGLCYTLLPFWVQAWLPALGENVVLPQINIGLLN